MKAPMDRFELLELHLQDSLTPWQKVALEKHREDKEFEINYQQTSALKNVIQKEGRVSMKQSLVKIEAQWQTQKKQKEILRVVLFLTILLVIFSVALGLSKKYFNQPKISNEELFALYYSPHPNTIDPLTKGDDSKQLTASQHYELENYTKAIELLSVDASSDVQQWYLAQAYLASDQLVKAEIILDEIIYYKRERAGAAKWYKSLVLLKKGNTEEAMGLLKTISNDQKNRYSKKAEEILSKL